MREPEQKGELIQFFQSPAVGCKCGRSQYKPHSQTKEQFLLSPSDSSPAFHVRETENRNPQDQPEQESDHCPSSSGVFITTQVKHTHLMCRALPPRGPPQVHLPGQLSQYKRHAIGFYVFGQQRLKGLKQGLSLPMADGGTNSCSLEGQAPHKCGQDPS